MGSSDSLCVTLALVAGVTLAPRHALAGGTRYWCVLPPDEDAAWDCGLGGVCDSAVALDSLPLAVAAARQATAAAAAGDIENHVFCVLGGEPLDAATTFDDRDGLLAGDATVLLRGDDTTNVCLEPGTALFTVLGQPLADPQTRLTVLGLRYRGTECNAGGELFVESQSARVVIERARVREAAAPLIHQWGAAPEPAVTLRDVRVEGSTGPILTGSGHFELFESEFSSNSSFDAPLIDLDGRLQFDRCGLHGNVVEGAPLVRSTGRATFIRSTIMANVVGRGFPLIESSTDWAEPTPFAGFLLSQLVDNAVVAGGVPEAALPGLRPVRNPDASEVCLPLAADGLSYSARPSPAVTGEVSEAPLVLLHPQPPVLSPLAAWSFLKSLALGNAQTAGAPLFRIVGADPIQVTLLHATVDRRLLVAGDGTTDPLGSRLVLGRSILPGAATASLADGWHVEASGNLLASEGPGFASGMPGLHGPDYSSADVTDIHEDASVVSALADCERAAAICPDLPSDCSPGRANSVCPEGSARAWIPTETAVAELSRPWPWATSFRTDPTAPASANYFGATAGSCGLVQAPWDAWAIKMNRLGDGDGFTDLTDCDNDDPDVVPRLPDGSGAQGVPCDETTGSCFICPEGSTQSPDPTPEVDPTPGPSADIPTDGCARNGCGMPFTCDEGSGAAILLPCLALLSRRRPATGARPRPRARSRAASLRPRAVSFPRSADDRASPSGTRGGPRFVAR